MANRRGLVVVLAMLAAMAFWMPPAFACSCAGPPDFAQAVADAEVVFEGEVTAYLGEGKSEVRVDRVYKGQVRAISVLHTDLQRGTSCRTSPPDPGPIVYAGPREITTTACQFHVWSGETVPMASYAPLPGAEDRGYGGWVSIGGALLGLLALPLARQTRGERRRRRRDAADLAALRLAR